jgi:aminopeptidase-like protein
MVRDERTVGSITMLSQRERGVRGRLELGFVLERLADVAVAESHRRQRVH